MNLRMSVVIATRDRVHSLVRLLADLDGQTLDREAFEIVVVDDGSSDPVGPMLEGLHLGVSLRHARIAWSGQAAARHHGAGMAGGEILLFVDDDMRVPAGFLATHLARHEEHPRSVVMGRIEADPGLERMPLFERYHARQLERWRAGILDGRMAPRGVHLCTGNVSVRRRDYEAVGGFDVSLRRSEDRELGIRLEKHGCQIVYADEAASVHCSDHVDAGVWLRRAYLYGRFDRRIAAQHPDVDNAHPWRFWNLINPLARPVIALTLVAPALAWAGSRATYGVAVLADRARLSGLAVTLTALSYALEYFRGLRAECGSLHALWRDRPASRTGVVHEFRAMLAAVRADHDSVRRYRQKYAGEIIAPSRLALDLVRKVGFQMLAWYRLMRFLHGCRVPILPMLVSRLIRHLYGAEIHWRTRIAPGVSIVHGNGLVLGHAAEIGEGCILFQNVTLGENIDPRSGLVGTPRLGCHVHVGPGATLLGPILVGDRSKVGAGTVLMRSVPPETLVLPAEAVATRRRERAAATIARRPRRAG